jgi:O-antigen ligase
MEVTVQRQNILKLPIGITLIALGAAIIWVAYPGYPGGKLALLAVAVLLVLGLKEPIWAMASLIVSQLTIPGYYIGPISLRLLLLLLIGIVLWRAHLQEKIQLGKGARRVIIPLIIFIVISLVSNFFYTDFDYVFKDFRNSITALLIIIFLPAVIRNIKDLKLMCGVATILMTISAIVALEQNFVGAGRVTGISESALQTAYILCIGFLAFLGILIVEGKKGVNRRLLIPAALMLPALYFTYTRSALIALLFGLVAMFLFLKTRIRSELILLVILGVTLYLSASGVTENFAFSARSEYEQQESGITRQALWQVGFAIAMDNPILGIGGNQYERVSLQYAESNIDLSILQEEYNRYFTYESLGLGYTSIHNDYLKMWVSYGIMALIVFLWIIMTILRNCIESFRISKSKFIKGLSLGLAAGLIAYSINAFFHNLLAEFPLVWIIAGFSVAAAKLAAVSQGQTAVVPPKTKPSRA